VIQENAMDKLIVFFSLLGALFGFDGGRDEVVHRIVVSGHDVLLSRASMRDGHARLDCLRSATGACHYVLLPTGCATEAACAARARRYDVAAGGTHRIEGTRGLRLCVIGRPGDAPQCTAAHRLGG
jgi:hypothetical protein